MNSLVRKFFLESVKQYPERDALEIDGQYFSYSYFNNLIERLIIAIEQQNIKGKAVVLLNEHTIYSYASLLAIHFSGNTILPVEPSWPRQRIEAILKQAHPAAFINCSSVHKNIFDDLRVGLIRIDAVSEVAELPEAGSENQWAEYKDIAYIIFTSGTTGTPKGVPVKTESLNTFLDYYKSRYDFSFKDRFLQVYELTFDVAYFSFLVPICCGACCCIVNSKQGIPKYLLIIDDLIKKNITVVSMVPTIINFSKKFFKKCKAPALRYSFFSGDILYHSDAVEWQDFAPNSEIHNYYGLTETTIVCTKYVWKKNQSPENEYNNNMVPIGKPFPGTFYKIIDNGQEEVNSGEVGELAFSGNQIIDSYLNAVFPEKFFHFKENGNTETLYFKTGDLVSVNEFGNLLFHGRVDQQVKVNGYRVELEEIQLSIEKITDRKNIVIKKSNENNVDYLKAFIEGIPVDKVELKEKLTSILPEYMIPVEFAFIEQLPLNENGKIDRLLLKKM